MNGRLVWITREQRDWLFEHYIVESETYPATWSVADAWDAAPSDPAEAMTRAWDNSAYPHQIISATLAALGMPVEAKP